MQRLEEKFAFLLHEVDEVYLPDVPSPIKHLLFIYRNENGGAGDTDAWSWDEICAKHADVVFEALGLVKLRPWIDDEAVKTTDRRMLLTEKRDLMVAPVDLDTWGPQAVGYEPFMFKITRCWSPAEAEERFTKIYRELRGEWDFYRSNR